MKLFQILLEQLGLGGLCPQYWQSSYPIFGNKKQAASMRNADLRSAHFLRPGPSRTRLTNGDGSGAVKQLIRKIMETAVSDNTTFGVGGTAVFKIQSTSITSDADFPHTIGGVSAKTAEDVVLYHSNIYYSYNHSATSGDVGKLTLPNTFDDDFLSTVPAVGAFALTAGVPHPMIVGGDDILYIGNGYRVSSYDITADTAVQTAIDLPDDCVIQDIEWAQKRLFITANYPSLAGSNQINQSIFIWNTVDSSWEDEVPQIKRGGALIKKGGIVYVFYEDITSQGEGRLGYFDGNSIKEICQFDGLIPAYYQTTEKDGFIVWVSKVGTEDIIMMWGAGDVKLPARLFQYCKAKFQQYVEGIACPFGSLIMPSSSTTAWDVSYEAGYENDFSWKSMTYPIALDQKMGLIKKITVDMEKLTGGSMVVALVDSKGNSVYSGNIAYGTDGAITKKIFSLSKRAEDVRVELSTPVSSGTLSYIAIKKVQIDGHSVL